MNKLLKHILLLMVVMVTIGQQACRKNNNEIKADATIINAGSPAVDGCGWLITIGNNTYKPDNLTTDFEINNQNVMITYTLLSTRYNCGFTQPTATSGYAYIHLISIKKQ